MHYNNSKLLTEISANTQFYPILGVGFGPSNLATAVAFQDQILRKPYLFLEKNNIFSWHPGMMLPHATLQNSCLKDLITLKNPKSEFTYLNYLHEQNELEAIINLGSYIPTRFAYTQYMQWAANKLKNHVKYNHKVLRIEPIVENDTVARLKISAENANQQINVYTTTNLILGIGAKPSIPFQLQLPAANIIHTDEYQFWQPVLHPHPAADYQFVIIGSGQSSAEILYDLLLKHPQAKIAVISRTYIFKSLQENPSINALFTSQGMSWYNNIEPDHKQTVFDDLKEADRSAVNASLVKQIYEKLYEINNNHTGQVKFYSYAKVHEIQQTPQHTICNLSALSHAGTIQLTSENMILATGYHYHHLDDYLKPLQDFIVTDSNKQLQRHDDYSLITTDAMQAKIYIHALHGNHFGVADGAMASMALRAATICESITKPSETQACYLL